MSFLVRDMDRVRLEDGWPTDEDLGRLVLHKAGAAEVLAGGAIRPCPKARRRQQVGGMAEVVTGLPPREASSNGRWSLDDWASSRLPYLDNLKVLLITAIIVIHAVLSYASTVEAWTYTEFREVTLSPVTEVALFVLVSPFAFFLIALLFLIAGLLTPASLRRKGGRRFATDRLLRLGVPFVLYVLLVQPALTYSLEHPLGDGTGSYWDEYLGAERRLDTGPLWFAGVLLVFSLMYAALASMRDWRGRARKRDPRVIRMRSLAVTAAVVAPASFVIRLAYPYGGESGFTDLNFWEWPACVAVFALGIRASNRGWITVIPDDLARRCRDVTLIGAAAMAVLLAVVGVQDAVDDAIGGLHWAAAAFAVIESLLTVFGSVWLLHVAQHRLDRVLPLGPQLSRSAYGAFIVQTAYLLGFAVALRPVGVPAEVKALALAVGSVTCSFATAWLLIKRVPWAARTL
jgi:hypothetical protein